jgi:hypothetical protein
MIKEEIIKKIEEALKKMGCSDILFPDPKEDLIVATFNCKEVTSFVADVPGWTYSGIQLDPTHTRQYKIDFIKLVSPARPN